MKNILSLASPFVWTAVFIFAALKVEETYGLRILVIAGLAVIFLYVQFTKVNLFALSNLLDGIRRRISAVEMRVSDLEHPDFYKGDVFL